ncbi:hypothetical protein FNF27_06005 [Cafeteria roenbergensis]|uniref:Uncharacterized protein n=2 Tax=Cafeteria roenbergensis TaxID=33653 RepID=A0A5A8E435_CAFRO|nr:hypothetical protein FNF27_06005 [Cafeteria roenbergensis]
MGPADVEAALAFKYRGEDRSLLYSAVLSPLAAALVELTPRWIAPNVLTVAALGFTVLSFTIAVLLHNPSLSEEAALEAPAWVAFAAAACLLVYQTLDNMDGKQARRLAMSSPLGLIVDHGCDAIHAGVLGPATAAAVLGTGSGTWQTAAVFWCGTAPFFTNSWESYHTGTFVLPVVNGPSDGLVLISGAFIAAGVFGTQSFREPLPQAVADALAAAAARLGGSPLAAAAASLSVSDAVILGMVLMSLLTIGAQVATVVAFEAGYGMKAAVESPAGSDAHTRLHQTVDGDRPRAPRGGPVAAAMRVGAALMRLLPAAALYLGAWATHVFAPAMLQRGAVLVMVAFGFAFTDFTVRIMVAHVAASEPSLWGGLLDSTFVMLPAMLEWSLQNTVTGPQWLSPGGVMAITLLTGLIQCSKVVQLAAEVSESLVDATGIPLWTVPAKYANPKAAKSD